MFMTYQYGVDGSFLSNVCHLVNPRVGEGEGEDLRRFQLEEENWGNEKGQAGLLLPWKIRRETKMRKMGLRPPI